MSLSRKNNWIDAHNRVYIIFPIDEIAEIMGVCHEKALNLLKELDDQSGIGLVRKKRRGLGLPSILYVKNFIVKGEQNTDRVPTSRSLENGIQEVGKTDIKKSENQTSANLKNRLLEVRNSELTETQLRKKLRNRSTMTALYLTPTALLFKWQKKSKTLWLMFSAEREVWYRRENVYRKKQQGLLIGKSPMNTFSM